ncbi:hypothetical protein BC940DRAFT_369658 [Gongronella butleri]|nr:hypothetical protein BC940DRAFT_369658 [Gongronella butleri]
MKHLTFLSALCGAFATINAQSSSSGNGIFHLVSRNGRGAVMQCEYHVPIPGQFYNEYLMHAPNTCGDKFNITFNSGNGQFSAQMVDGSLKGKYLCFSASHKYVTYCDHEYTFEYEPLPDGSYRVGWNGYALDWSSETAFYCKSRDTKYMRIGSDPIYKGDPFWFKSPSDASCSSRNVHEVDDDFGFDLNKDKKTQSASAGASVEAIQAEASASAMPQKKRHRRHQ